MTWKIEKKTLNGLETFCIVSANGAMRHASVEEVDLWADILKLKAERDELLEFINKFAFRGEGLIKAKTGKGLQDDKVPSKSTPYSSSKPEVKADKPADTKAPAAEPKPGMGGSYSAPTFGKKAEPVSESMAEKFRKKFGRYPSGYDKDKAKSANGGSKT